MRKTICRSNRLALLVAGVALAPAAASAQADTAALHVVRRGDTLWDLAIQYLRDPFGWPTIYRDNRDVVENPHRIYPGERLRIPGGVAPADAVAAGQSRGQAGAPSDPARVGGITVTPAGADTAGGVSFVVTVDNRLGDENAAAARRLADYLSAPYVAPLDGPPTLGVVESTEHGLASAKVDVRALALGDEVRLVLGADVVPTPGARLVVAAMGERVNGGRLVRPTGIVEIAEFEGSLARGHVVAVLGELREGQRLLPLPQVPADAEAVAGSPVRVTWVETGRVLPALQDWLILSAAPGASVTEGAVVELVRPARGSARTGLVEVLGRARVARATPFGASAYIIDIDESGIGVGTQGAVVAR